MCYLIVLGSLSPSTVIAANSNPCELLLPFARILIDEISVGLQAFSHEETFANGDASNAKTTILERAWAVLHDTELDSTPNLKRLHRLSHFHAAATIIGDYENVLGLIERITRDPGEYLNRHVAIMAIKESKKSIELADSVKALAQVVLIFMPQGPVMSFFRMNFVELGTETLKIWIFGVVVVVVLMRVANLWRWGHMLDAKVRSPMGHRQQ